MDARKYHGDIDAITASTITSRAFLKGITLAYDVFRTLNPENNEQQPQ